MWALWPAAAALGEGEAPRCHRGTPSGGGGREAAFLWENKGRPGGGASRPVRALAGRKPGHSGLGGGTRCSFVRAEWGGGSRCHVVAPLFRRLPTRALWEGVKGRAEDRAVPAAESETLAGLSLPGRRSAVRPTSGHRWCLKRFCYILRAPEYGCVLGSVQMFSPPNTHTHKGCSWHP